MAKTYNKLNIEINQKVTDIITAVQDDTNSRYLDVQLFDNGTPIDLTGQEVRIYLQKPDGTNIWNDGEVTNATEGRCQFLLTTQTLAVCGELKTQISIWQNNEEILSTEIFKIFVTKSLRSDGSIESSNEYGSLVILFQNIYEALDLMTEMVQSFGTAGAVAQGIPATTFWQMLEAVYSVNAEALANASVSEVLNRMGLTNDSGATATTGTLMGKMNNLIGTANDVSSKTNISSCLGLNNYTPYFQGATSLPSTTNDWTTLINVDGSGYLSAIIVDLFAYNAHNRNCGVRISIDGEYILNYKIVANSLGSSAYIANFIINKNNMYFTDRCVFFNESLNKSTYSFSTATPFIPNNVETTNEQRFLTNNELRFNNNLKVEYTTSSGNGNFLYLYFIEN